MYNSDFLPVRVGAKPHEELNDDDKNPNNYPGKAGYRTHKWHSRHKKSKSDSANADDNSKTMWTPPPYK